MKFVGRREELERLESLTLKKSASLVVIRGRRRIGKSRLIQEFVSNKKEWSFSGIAPIPGMTKQRQLDAFSRQISRNLKTPQFKTSEWSDYFAFLGEQSQKKKLVIVLDEISWMGSMDPDFLGELKNAWDLYFSRNQRLILILCGSASGWIEENILSNTGFVGRISVNILLGELSLAESNAFWMGEKSKVSPYEKFKILSITGGVPKYLEEFIPEKTAERNIQELCFKADGMLFNEFDQIFSDLFLKRTQTYQKIIKILAEAPLTFSEIYKKLGVESSGSLSKYLGALEAAGFVNEDYTWNLFQNSKSRLKKFRLKDNYIRFYLKYIEPSRGAIVRGSFSPESFMYSKNWESIMGLQFENLVINSWKSLCKRLGINLFEVSHSGPFFQRPSKRQKGCQIDLMIQTKHSTLYVCEIKFRMSEIKGSIISEMKQKIEALSIPRRFSIRPVLIHVNGVSRSVKESDLFSNLIDFSTLLEGY